VSPTNRNVLSGLVKTPLQPVHQACSARGAKRGKQSRSSESHFFRCRLCLLSLPRMVRRSLIRVIGFIIRHGIKHLYYSILVKSSVRCCLVAYSLSLSRQIDIFITLRRRCRNRPRDGRSRDHANELPGGNVAWDRMLKPQSLERLRFSIGSHAAATAYYPR